ncbi:50S ribosomal protein L32 [Candidatus Hodgkinia cicadicola]|uniref:50S ribosomal protein L32 n=1 Tax=Candidatus Hodgkinia cicadicola TaxID=573658 RepID=A0ABX4MHB0_9HYPH|nr:50S ribosomal protein L32 [Candidatus Hodgkinia cicadicola]
MATPKKRVSLTRRRTRLHYQQSTNLLNLNLQIKSRPIYIKQWTCNQHRPQDLLNPRHYNNKLN